MDIKTYHANRVLLEDIKGWMEARCGIFIKPTNDFPTVVTNAVPDSMYWTSSTLSENSGAPSSYLSQTPWGAGLTPSDYGWISITSVFSRLTKIVYTPNWVGTNIWYHEWYEFSYATEAGYYDDGPLLEQYEALRSTFPSWSTGPEEEEWLSGLWNGQAAVAYMSSQIDQENLLCDETNCIGDAIAWGFVKHQPNISPAIVFNHATSNSLPPLAAGSVWQVSTTNVRAIGTGPHPGSTTSTVAVSWSVGSSNLFHYIAAFGSVDYSIKSYHDTFYDGEDAYTVATTASVARISSVVFDWYNDLPTFLGPGWDSDIDHLVYHAGTQYPLNGGAYPPSTFVIIDWNFAWR